MTDETEQPRKHHYEVERQIVDAEIGLADSLERLSEVEERLGLGGDADHRLEQAAELDKRARSHVDHLRHELEEEEAGHREEETAPTEDTAGYAAAEPD